METLKAFIEWYKNLGCVIHNIDMAEILRDKFSGYE